MHEAMISQSDKLGSFAHGYTHSGHPVATAVALEVLKIYEEMDVNARAQRLGRRMLDGLKRFSDHPLVGDVAGVGLIAGIELVQDKRTRAGYAPAGRAGKVIDRIGHEHGLVLRVIGDRIAFAPPFVISEGEIEEMLTGLGRTLDAAHEELAG
jgi:4-aminobutyrate--pyruvate transaminase